MHEAPTLEDLYLAQVVTLAHVLRLDAERRGDNKDLGVHIDEADRLLTSGKAAVLERRRRRT